MPTSASSETRPAPASAPEPPESRRRRRPGLGGAADRAGDAAWAHGSQVHLGAPPESEGTARMLARAAAREAGGVAVDEADEAGVVEGAPALWGLEPAAFLQQLRDAIAGRVEASLAPRWTARGCPYIEAWFRRAAGDDAAALERRVVGIVGDHDTPDALIAEAAELAGAGVDVWSEGGDVSGHLEAAGLGNLVGRVPTSREGDEADAPDAESVAASLGEGRPLPPRLRDGLGHVYGADVSGVKLHTDAAALALASGGKRADAAAIGDHVAVSPAVYAEGDPRSDAVVAHEVAHTLQQQGDGTSEGGAAHEADADRAAVAAMGHVTGRRKVQRGQGRPRQRAGLGLQRCESATAEVHYSQERDPDFDEAESQKESEATLAGIVEGQSAEGWSTQSTKLVEAIRTTFDVLEAGFDAINQAAVEAEENFKAWIKAVGDDKPIASAIVAELFTAFAVGTLSGMTMVGFRSIASSSTNVAANLAAEPGWLSEGFVDLIKGGLSTASGPISWHGGTPPGLSMGEAGSFEDYRANGRKYLVTQKDTYVELCDFLEANKVTEFFGKPLHELVTPMQVLTVLSDGLATMRTMGHGMSAGVSTKEFEKELWLKWIRTSRYKTLDSLAWGNCEQASDYSTSLMDPGLFDHIHNTLGMRRSDFDEAIDAHCK